MDSHINNNDISNIEDDENEHSENDLSQNDEHSSNWEDEKLNELDELDESDKLDKLDKLDESNKSDKSNESDESDEFSKIIMGKDLILPPKGKAKKILDKKVSDKAHLQPRQKKDGMDYLGLCDDLISKVESSDPMDIQEFVKGISQLKSKLSNIKKIGENFRKKDTLICAFAITAKNVTGQTPYTKSEYDRKYIECCSALSDLFADGIFGNPISTDIIFIFEYCEYHKYIMFMEQLRYTTSKVKNERLVFGDYRLDVVTKQEIFKNNVSNIKYNMVMTDVNTNVSIKVSCVKKKQNSINTRVEHLDVCSVDNTFECLGDLCQRKAVLSFNLAKAIGELNGTMERKKRAKILGKVCEVLSKDIDLLNKGYVFLNIGKDMTLDFDIEKDETCYLTNVDAPYVKINLECGHGLSLMALYGIVYKGGSTDTEAIVCPTCRKNIVPKMVNLFESEEQKKKYMIKIYKKEDLECETTQDTFTFEENEMIKNSTNSFQDSKEFIDSLFGKKTLDINSDSDDDDDVVETMFESDGSDDYDYDYDLNPTNGESYDALVSSLANYVARSM